MNPDFERWYWDRYSRVHPHPPEHKDLAETAYMAGYQLGRQDEKLDREEMQELEAAGH